MTANDKTSVPTEQDIGDLFGGKAEPIVLTDEEWAEIDRIIKNPPQPTAEAHCSLTVG